MEGQAHDEAGHRGNQHGDVDPAPEDPGGARWSPIWGGRFTISLPPLTRLGAAPMAVRVPSVTMKGGSFRRVMRIAVDEADERPQRQRDDEARQWS